MPKVDLGRITRRFLEGKLKEEPTIRAYLESISSVLESIKPKSLKENRKLLIVIEQLREIKMLSRRLEERVFLLEEQVKILEEGR